MEHTRALAEGLGDVFQNGITGAMQNMLHTGNSILDQLIDKLIESMMTTQAMESMFSNFGSGISSFFGFANGGAFSATSAIRAYAAGDAFHNSVLTSPVLFRTPDRRQAVAGEAGAEAIMPMPNGGVLAQLGGNVLDLPLTRIAGKLAVNLDQANLSPLAPFANGGAFGTSAPSRTNSNGSAVMQPKISIQVINNGQPANATTSQSVDQNGDVQIKIWMETIDNEVAKGIRTKRSQTYQALKDTL